MTSRTLTLLAAATLGVAGIASAQVAGAGQGANMPPDKPVATDTGQMGATGAQPSDMPIPPNQKITDKDFVKQASSAGQYEVDAAKLVQSKASDPQIKQLAKTMESDHKQLNDELKRIAKQSNIEVLSIPQGHDQQMLSQLRQADDQQLGQQYIQQQIQAHQKSIDLFRQAQTQLQDPQLKSFAERTLPKLEQHLQHLQQMSAPPAQPAGAALPGAVDNPPMDKPMPIPDNPPAVKP